MPVSAKDGGFAKWRMKEPCDDCPFGQTEAGQAMQELLREYRWDSITASLLKGEHFLCHKTTQDEGWNEDDDGHEKYEIVGPELICTGSIEWQARRGIKADLVQVMERMEIAHQRGRTKKVRKNDL